MIVLFSPGARAKAASHVIASAGTAHKDAALAAILLQANQNEQHGGQSIPNFDYAMAPGVDKSFRKALKRNLAKYNKFAGKKLDLEVKDSYQFGDDKKLERAKWPKENNKSLCIERYLHVFY